MDDWGKAKKPSWGCEHKELVFGKGVILGGSCLHPAKGYDIYVGLDTGMDTETMHFPWDDKVGFLYRITDMQSPKSPKSFSKLISWLCLALDKGKRIHVGCVGGHGRTGLVLAAIAKEINCEMDAITWVRDNYCKKAVETQSQVNFLHKHYGIKKVEMSKTSCSGSDWDIGGYSATTTGRTHSDRILYQQNAEECVFNTLTN